LWYSQNEEEVSWRATNMFNENNGEQPNESTERDESVEYKDGLGRISVRNKIEGAIETGKKLEHLQEIKFVIRKGRFSTRVGKCGILHHHSPAFTRISSFRFSKSFFLKAKYSLSPYM
jgi:hypothetical protein